MKVDPRSIADGLRYAQGYYSRHSGGAMCEEGKLNYDGYMTTINCRVKGDYADCATCEYNPNYENFIEVDDITTRKYPKFQYSFKPIPSYCTNCKNKATCKDIQQGIEWCPNKEQ